MLYNTNNKTNTPGKLMSKTPKATATRAIHSPLAFGDDDDHDLDHDFSNNNNNTGVGVVSPPTSQRLASASNSASKVLQKMKMTWNKTREEIDD